MEIFHKIIHRCRIADRKKWCQNGNQWNWETGELSVLSAKSTSQPLTEGEKRKVKAQLLDVAKTIPALAIFVLPAGAIVLAVLIKVLPFNILPSAFDENS